MSAHAVSANVPSADVRLFEVGPRDGLQNETTLLSVDQKVALIERLVLAGARDIEIGSFVHPRWVPQMAETGEVAARLTSDPGTRFWALVPNPIGLERAIDAGVKHVAVFLSSSETHNQNNLNRTIAESLANLEDACRLARAEHMMVRAYVSTVFGCPFEGQVDFARVLEICARLLDFGAFQVSLGDTTGVGKPYQVREGCRLALEAFGPEAVALHLHDTQGLALANSLLAYEVGVRHFDSAVAGMGGCPYAPGAAGNVSTEDLVNLFEAMGLDTAYDLDAVCATARWLNEETGIAPRSRYFAYWGAHHPQQVP
ncbi:MAG: hydroxymethylglutaryl-CoA lyase [Bradymonadaceae bacterium]|nr:hydroxymethylglutaryl-CoA lyase [Lujinxingiaceae bacterium]